ncbi:MAG: cysteine--tRNA ligase [Elusimicrobia bacterium]|jgi:cysteinyl-tRNA synthetase|nr:MAG: cysteine--tRNA ligase [Elusimicrobiota bacterium]
MTDRPVRFHNTLSGKEEAFHPLTPGRINMYVCGVTPYDACHLGHARCYVTFDFIRRALTRLGYAVTHVQNFTDIDDKIIHRAAERGEAPAVLAERYIADYFDKMDKLGVRRADAYPRVTGSLPAIVAFIERLVAKGLAYAAGGDVFYAVRKFPGYGKLSKRSPDDLQVGARVEVDDRKSDPLDFALWKAAKPGEPAWPSPWGPGRPGWHIECSAMSLAAFGDTFDIHGGGQDLVFPHHENEIAQSEGATGRSFARYWIHNGFVTVNKEKMSKSLGNFFTLEDIFKKFAPRAVRYFLLTHHYKGPLEFSDEQLAAADARLKEVDADLRRLDAALKTPLAAKPKEAKAVAAALDAFGPAVDAALADNFNAPKALAVLFALLGELKERAERPKAIDVEGLRRGVALVRDTFRDVLGLEVGGDVVPGGNADADVAERVARREAARKARNWAEADRLRAELLAAGVTVEDTPQGPRWWRS